MLWLMLCRFAGRGGGPIPGTWGVAGMCGRAGLQVCPYGRNWLDYTPLPWLGACGQLRMLNGWREASRVGVRRCSQAIRDGIAWQTGFSPAEPCTSWDVMRER